MSASDELRRLLDEYGVEYATDDHATSNDTMWTTQNGGWMFDCDYMEPLNAKPGTVGAKTELMIYGYTPEQAIAATLGRGECILHECEGSFSAVNRPVWLCDCGAFVTQYTDATTYHKPRFCPNCGAHVKGGAE